MKKYKVIFADLDGTLIDTISGEIFPKGIWDMRIKFEILDKIKELKPLALVIVTNQGGIESGFVDRRNFKFKIEYICRSIKEYTGVFTEYSYCTSNDSNNSFRKPNTGMLETSLFKIKNIWFKQESITYDDTLMIGDASGKEGQFSDSDKKCAENFGIDYMDVDDFIKTVII